MPNVTAAARLIVQNCGMRSNSPSVSVAAPSLAGALSLVAEGCA